MKVLMPKFCIVIILCSCISIEAAPVPKRLVDLTHVFNNETLHFPTVKNFEIKVVMNETFRDVYRIQAEEYSSSTHVGTHTDAPCHFVPGRWSIDEIPLQRLIAPVIVINIEEKAKLNQDYEVTVNDLIELEEETGQILNNTILMIRSGWGKRWGDRERFTGTPGYDPLQMHYPGLSPEAAQWLVDHRDIYGLGTETLSPDYGQSREVRVHTILLSQNIFLIENVANVDQLPPYGATLYVMPMKLENSSGAPTRVVATFVDSNLMENE